MKNRYKIYGNVVQDHLEINLDLSRWLLGFGWCGHRFKVVHINFGPLAVLYCWKSKKVKNYTNTII